MIIESMGVNVVFGLLILIVSIIRAQEYVILDDPVFDIWDGQETEMAEVERQFSELCKHYQLIVNDERIDCSNVYFAQKDEDDRNHVIRKREADDTVLEEGSGNGQNELPEIALYNETTTAIAAASGSLAGSRRAGVPAGETLKSDEVNEEPDAKSPVVVPQVEQPDNQHSNSEDSAAFNQTEKPTAKKGTSSETTTTTSTQRSSENTTASEKANAEKEDEEMSRAITSTTPQKIGSTEPSSQSSEASSIGTTTASKKADAGNEQKSSEKEDDEISRAITSTTPQKIGSTESPLQSSIASSSGTTTASEKADEVNEQRSSEKKDDEISRAITSTTAQIISSESTTPPSSSEASSSESAAAVADRNSDKDGSMRPEEVLPKELEEVESVRNAKESEIIDEAQSGNAFVFKQSKLALHTPVEGSDSDKLLAAMPTNARINDQPTETEDPNTGESASNITKSGKDTTILIVLFVAVIVIGAAAFTHNFIKKRKQKSSETSDIVNGIRRSLQNLSAGNAKPSTDVEQGTEMKPLMKTDSPVMVKEYTDTKKELTA